MTKVVLSKIVRLALVVQGALSAVACSAPADAPASSTSAADGGAGGGACSVAPTFTSVRERVLTSGSCAKSGCHGTPGQSGLSFDGDATTVYRALVGAASHGSTLARVRPGAPSESFLYLKVSEAAPPSGVRMPQGAPALTACEIDAIRGWIEGGAPQD